MGLEISAGREGCGLRFLRRNHARAAPTMTAAITPTAMPALAAPVRPAAASVSSSFSLSSFVAPLVGAEVDVEDEDEDEDKDELNDVDEEVTEEVVEVDWVSEVADSAVVDPGATVLEVSAGAEDSAGCDVVEGGAEVVSGACEVVTGGAEEDDGAGGSLDGGGADDSGAAGADDCASAGGEKPAQNSPERKVWTASGLPPQGCAQSRTPLWKSALGQRQALSSAFVQPNVVKVARS
jgi:hypothetical protein